MNRQILRRGQNKNLKRFLGSALTLMLLVQLFGYGAFALNTAYAEQPENPGNGSAHQMINICHRDGQSGNWNALTINENGANGHLNSHHQDDMDYMVSEEDLGENEFTDEWCMDNAPNPPAEERASLTVTKVVVGGNKVAADFPLFLNGMSLMSGVATTTLSGGHYTVTETTSSDYDASFSGDCDEDGNVHLESGDSKNCTLTNTFDDSGSGGSGTSTATLTVTKTVVGGDMEVNDFPLFLNGMSITSGVATTTGIGTYVVTEETSTNYTGSFGGDCNSSGHVTLSQGQVKTCTLTNTFTGTTTGTTTTGTIIVHKVVINDNGGTGTTTDFSFSLNGATSTSFEADGANILVVATGTHNIVEPAVLGYAAFYNGCSNISIAPGQTKTCTITNNDIAPGTTGNIIVNKVVINNNSGTSTASSFPLFVGTTSVVMGATTTMPLGTYTVSETYNPNLYAQSFSGNCNSSGVITLSSTSTVTCTITNHDLPQLCPANAGYIESDTNTMVGTSSAALLTFVHPAWTADVDGASTSARWIWSTDPVATTSTSTVTFQRAFTVNGSSTSATLNLASDNTYTVWINGNLVGASIDGNNFELGTQDSYNVSSFLVDGANTLTIEVTNAGTPGVTDPQSNPAGLLYSLSWTATDCLSDEGGQGGDNNVVVIAGTNDDDDDDNKKRSRTIIRGNNDDEDDDDVDGQVLGISTTNPDTPLGQVLGLASTLPGLPSTGMGPLFSKARDNSGLPILIVGLLAMGGLYVLQYRLLKKR